MWGCSCNSESRKFSELWGVSLKRRKLWRAIYILKRCKFLIGNPCCSFLSFHVFFFFFLQITPDKCLTFNWLFFLVSLCC